MIYDIEFFPAKKLDVLKEQWEILENGPEMTLFQSFCWYQMLADCYIPDDCSHFISLFALVRRDGIPVLIAPLWIVKHTFRFMNKKGVYLLGRDSYGDYLNVIYNVFDGMAFDSLIKNIKSKYRVDNFQFEQLMESSSTYHHIVHSGYHVIEDRSEPCASLTLPQSQEEYQKMLSKNSRQNIRTANNRLAKDGKTLVFNFDDEETDRSSCMEIRESKLAVKFAKVSALRKYKYRLVNRLLFHFPRFAPLQVYKGSKIMTAKDQNGHLRAFFCYGYDTQNKCVRVMSAGTDLEYARYSPGILLMYDFISKAIADGQIRVIDFTRGDEKYKFALGSVLCNNHIVSFRKQ